MNNIDSALLSRSKAKIPIIGVWLIVTILTLLVFEVLFKSLIFGRGWSTYTPGKTELSSTDVEAVVIDKNDQLWIGSYDGVKVFDPNTGWTNYTPITRD